MHAYDIIYSITLWNKNFSLYFAKICNKILICTLIFVVAVLSIFDGGRAMIEDLDDRLELVYQIYGRWDMFSQSCEDGISPTCPLCTCRSRFTYNFYGEKVRKYKYFPLPYGWDYYHS